MMRVPGLPPARWLAEPGAAEVRGSTLTMSAPPGSDWFNDPASDTRHRSAPVLVVDANDDFQLSAHVSVGFADDFDAGVLFVHQGPDDYAKLCFERSPAGEPMIVTVVTRGVSDDSNEPVIAADAVHLRVSRTDRVFAFHYAVDDDPLDRHSSDAGDRRSSDHQSGDRVRWRLSRLFALRDPAAPTTVGFCAQSPTGRGCTVRFDDVRWTPTTLTDARDGS